MNELRISSNPVKRTMRRRNGALAGFAIAVFGLATLMGWVWIDFSAPLLRDSQGVADLQESFDFALPSQITRIDGSRRVFAQSTYILDGTSNGLYIVISLDSGLVQLSHEEPLSGPDFDGAWVRVSADPIVIREQEVLLERYASSNSLVAWTVQFEGKDGTVGLDIAVDPTLCDESVALEFVNSIR